MRHVLSILTALFFLHPVRNREDVECSGDDDDKDTFHPAYAHQVFDESENIFGYRDLKVRLYYTAGSLNMYLGLKYSQRVDDLHQPEFKADNVNGKISDLLSSGCYYTNMDEFLKTLSVDDDFLPFGEKVDSVAAVEQVVSNGRQRNFEFYRCDMQTKGFAAFHVRLQTFLMWFVDAASYIDADDPSWTFFVWLVHWLLALIIRTITIFIFSYERYTNSAGQQRYATAGFTTIYLYYSYPENVRPRISQMLVLPPFQRLGIGTKFIEVVYQQFRNDPKVADITVEDPSDEFRRIRNLVDVQLCRPLAAFARARLADGFSKEMIAEAKNKFKVKFGKITKLNIMIFSPTHTQINARQCRTVYEILRLLHTNVNDESEYRAYRLAVKKRLNLTYHKQKSEIKTLVRLGVDTQWIHAGLPTTEERIEQLQIEYKVIVLFFGIFIILIIVFFFPL